MASPASSDGGSAISIIRQMRVEPPVLCRASASRRFLNSSRNFRVGQHRRGRRVGGKARKLAAGLDIGKHQRRDLVAVQAGDHRVANERRAVIDELGAQRARAHPCAARELEIFGEAAVEQEALAGIARVLEPERVAHLVEAFVVEGFLGEVADAANSPA